MVKYLDKTINSSQMSNTLGLRSAENSTDYKQRKVLKVRNMRGFFGKRQMQKSLPFQGGFLFNGADTQNRTGDLILTKDALYRLSHISTLTGKDHAIRVI